MPDYFAWQAQKIYLQSFHIHTTSKAITQSNSKREESAMNEQKEERKEEKKAYQKPMLIRYQKLTSLIAGTPWSG